MRRFTSLNIKYLLTTLILIVAILGGAILWLRQAHPIPRYITSQINHIILYPDANSGVTVDTSSFKYDDANKLLSYSAKMGGTAITVSEQATPESFTDIPQAYDKFVSGLGEYGSFDSSLGKVYLTHPKDLNGQQSAVMNTKGTLLFIHPTNGDLSDDQWRKIFNGLRVVK